MIIFGTRGVTYAKERGGFFCPVCNARKEYTRRRVRRFFTLYFIPVLPLDVVSEYIECRTCLNTFREAVLAYDPEAEAARLNDAYCASILRVMVHMALAGGGTDVAGIEKIRQIYAGLTRMELSPDEIRAESNAVCANRLDVERSLADCAPHLNENGKEIVLRAAIMVGIADGRFDDRKWELLERVARTVQMAPAHFRGVISEYLTPDDAGQT